MAKLKAQLTEVDKAFVRGFAAATAQTVRHQVMTVDLMRSISATERLLKDSGVDEYDLEELRPALRALRKRRQ